MENFDQVTGRAAQSAACSLLSTYGEQAPALTAFALAEPTPWGEVVAAGAWVAQYAARKNCNWDPEQPGPPGDHIVRGCHKVSPGGKMSITLVNENGSGNKFENDAIEILNAETFENSYGEGMYRLTYLKETGEVTREDRSGDGTRYYQTEVRVGSCEKEDPGPTPRPPGPHTYTDPETGCTMNVTFQAWAVGAGNQTNPVFLIEPVTEERSDGGRIGGCNFMPTIYSDTGGPGGPNIPIPPGPQPPGPGGEPWWVPFVRGAAQGIGALAAQELLKALFRTPLPKAAFSFVAPCDKYPDGTNEEVVYELDPQNYQSRVLSQQAVIMEILQQHLNWKTPTCNGPSTKGRYARSITFQSDENTDRGNRRCVKRFGYRSNTACELESLHAHWRNFSWDTGPVIVRHRGSALGSVEVWAASVDEGKRVIQHAGREAGVDPDQVGEWSVGSTNSPRYGLSHKVRLMEVRGLWQATAREGPDGYAEAVWTPPDL